MKENFAQSVERKEKLGRDIATYFYTQTLQGDNVINVDIQPTDYTSSVDLIITVQTTQQVYTVGVEVKYRQLYTYNQFGSVFLEKLKYERAMQEASKRNLNGIYYYNIYNDGVGGFYVKNYNLYDERITNLPSERRMMRADNYNAQKTYKIVKCLPIEWSKDYHIQVDGQITKMQ